MFYPQENYVVGDLLRMCTRNEADDAESEWCYGLYVGKQRDDEAEEHGWIPRPRNLVLYNGQLQAFDHYWYIERIS